VRARLSVPLAEIAILGITALIPLSAGSVGGIDGALRVTSTLVHAQRESYVAHITVTCYSETPVSAFAVTYAVRTDDGLVTTKTTSLDMVPTIPLTGVKARGSYNIHLGLMRAGDSDEFTVVVGSTKGHGTPVVQADVSGIIFAGGKWMAANSDAERYLDVTFRMRTRSIQDYTDQLAALRAGRSNGKSPDENIAALRARAEKRTQGGASPAAELALAERNAKMGGETSEGALRRYEERLEQLIQAYQSEAERGERLQ